MDDIHCKAIGRPPIAPLSLSLSAEYIVFASHEAVILICYQRPQTKHHPRPLHSQVPKKKCSKTIYHSVLTIRQMTLCVKKMTQVRRYKTKHNQKQKSSNAFVNIRSIILSRVGAPQEGRARNIALVVAVAHTHCRNMCAAPLYSHSYKLKNLHLFFVIAHATWKCRN